MKVLYRCYEGVVKVLCRCYLCVMLYMLSRCYESIVCIDVKKVLNIFEKLLNKTYTWYKFKFMLYMLHCIHLLDRCVYLIEV